MSDVRGTLKVNGVGLYYELRGEGEPLVLVHGSWTDLDSWAFVVPALAESFQVLTYDRRGHSRSERPASQGSRRQDENDLVALVQALGLAPVHLVGNSYGGSISLSVACSRPDIVRTVAAHEPPLLDLLDGNSRFRQIIEGVWATAAVVDAELAAGEVEAGTSRFVEDIALGPGSWALLPPEMRDALMTNAPMFRDLLRDPAWPRLDRGELAVLEVPTLVTDGDQSASWMPGIVSELARLIPGAEHHTFAGAGHVPHLTHVEEYVQRIGAFARAEHPAYRTVP